MDEEGCCPEKPKPAPVPAPKAAPKPGPAASPADLPAGIEVAADLAAEMVALQCAAVGSTDLYVRRTLKTPHVSAALARQEAEREAQAAQARRLADEVSRRRGGSLGRSPRRARSWRTRRCGRRAHRRGSGSSPGEGSGGGGVGGQTVKTGVGPLVRAVAAVRETVSVSELASAALAAVKAGPKAGCTVQRVPAGSFTVGSPPSESGRDDDEAQVRVRLGRGWEFPSARGVFRVSATRLSAWMPG
jgi:hypothetical protein